MKKRLTCLVLALMTGCSILLAGCGGAQDDQSPIEKATGFLQEEVTQPMYGMVGGEWTMFDLARAGMELEEAYVKDYLATVEQALTESGGVLNERRYTEYSRVVIALSALGEDVTDVVGYNMLDYLTDYESVCRQGLSGPIWALIAMDCKGYSFSEGLDVAVIADRDLYISYILERTHALGGWGYDPTEADPDLTAMAIVALAPYADSNAEVAAAIDSGIDTLSRLQGENGTYESGGVSTAESCAQVLLALAMMDIDGATDERFVKNGTSVYDALLGFALKDGSFCHIKGDDFDLLATEQVCYCLLGYERFLNGETDLFDLSEPLQ